jgi:peptide-methionine (S)-S-oxide reductase
MTTRKLLYFFVISTIIIVSCIPISSNNKIVKLSLNAPKGKSIAAFAEGCFWCSEHIFEAVVGVEDVISGYAGGSTSDPTYESVNTETTGHAEAVYIIYNPKVISYKELCRVFFSSHDPTTLNRQGPDVGSSYRSILFYRTDSEKLIAEDIIKEFSIKYKNNGAIVTELQKLSSFYQAEDYHQNFIANNPNQPYVVNVSLPRFELFKKNYKGALK